VRDLPYQPIDFGISRDKTVRWPVLLFAILSLIFTALCLIASKAEAATVSIAGKTCALSGATYQADARFAVYTCGTVYLSGFAGASFDGDVFVIPGASSVDRIAAGSFEAQP